MGSGGDASDRSAHPRDVAADLEVLDGLLSTLTDVLDIREVFDRVSQLVQRVLPHDALEVTEISEKGDRIRLLAAAGIAGEPENFEAPILGPDFVTKPWNIMVIDDVPISEISEKGDRIRLLAAAGIAGEPENFEAPILGPDFVTKPWNIMVIDDVP